MTGREQPSRLREPAKLVWIVRAKQGDPLVFADSEICQP